MASFDAGSLHRRRLMASAGAVAVTAASAGARAEAPPRPNILFILADDLGYADLGCYGRRGIATPNIDRLAREGVKLTQAYANSAVCSASRTAIITGRYQYRVRVGLEEPVASLADGEVLTLPPGRPTLPSIFKAAGYHTALIGKWHLAGGIAGPRHAGYDYFYGFHPGANDYFRRPTAKEAAEKDYPGAALYENESVIQPKGYLTDLLADAAIRRVEATLAGDPFLISLHFNAPHWPWEGPGDEAKSAKIKSLRDEDSGSEAIYARMIEAMDRAIGRVLEAVERSGRGGDTIVVFTSDNGGERYSDTWPLIGMKGELLEGGIRVPALVRWPGHLPAGQVSPQVAVGMDWLPTLAALAGVTLPADLHPDGEDLSAVLFGRAPPRPRKLFWRYKASEQAAVRDGDWKYLRLGGAEHLFNIAEDERERADHKALEPAILKRLKAAYDDWNREMLPYSLSTYSETPKGRMADRY